MHRMREIVHLVRRGKALVPSACVAMVKLRGQAGRRVSGRGRERLSVVSYHRCSVRLANPTDGRDNAYPFSREPALVTILHRLAPLLAAVLAFHVAHARADDYPSRSLRV